MLILTAKGFIITNILSRGWSIFSDDAHIYVVVISLITLMINGDCYYLHIASRLSRFHN